MLHTTIRLTYESKNDGKVMEAIRRMFSELDKAKLIKRIKHSGVITKATKC